MSETQSAIVGEGLSKVFRDFWRRPKVAALTDVDLDVPAGTIFGLLGPNGAGKSTLLKLILGHLFPTKGRLAVLGASPRNVENKRRLGYLPERTNLYKHLTAEETLKLFGGLLDLSGDQIKSRSEQLLEMVGLSHARKRRVGEFSHGMGRRLGLAQALLNDPDLVILDEPTAGMDPVGCREVKDLILALKARGKTVLLTSHLLADVEDVCNDLMVLYGGKVRAKGQVNDLLKDRERMTLEFPRVSEKALAAATAALTVEVGADDVKASSPSETLESFFLKLVADSQGSQHTDGVRMGSGVAEYLQAGGRSGVDVEAGRGGGADMPAVAEKEAGSKITSSDAGDGEGSSAPLEAEVTDIEAEVDPTQNRGQDVVPAKSEVPTGEEKPLDGPVVLDVEPETEKPAAPAVDHDLLSKLEE
jgi:ABC-2 type transport system ATP-binding protein